MSPPLLSQLAISKWGAQPGAAVSLDSLILKGLGSDLAVRERSWIEISLRRKAREAQGICHLHSLNNESWGHQARVLVKESPARKLAKGEQRQRKWEERLRGRRAPHDEFSACG